ncbi:MAG: phosphoribosylformylglycinamidine synthase I [Candidatus Altiarchaeum hamiconexum]|uniref:Phosphoribosylformylglycinamidine synthase I n=1 Tax=Candidatus Altarchaeum hamiconexum TaxID=1803513 RepID=A0A8J7Z291_9ARCH|nr:phosphoribosylformylglycinamidine synthase I [Candidatus Altarchaeum hamiconexum]OIQ05280.1 MAG: phosphoribosylformylglycinamidine synthase I [Candidatus Altarchaeum sp. CG2_30_32_3053]PIN67895.1 MAG: phosphoribosylformylglycinamidine synthase I [Candidatus Altarchaeum sp. CG12_big_fil_rev_8_21_14_0_65_33_22]PIV28456.1 MAG: phosphoribosylformylglycinamidine synthase I [Candidatus Altarchaeum sp. CG03_land_8_20_14_0_80_32_618]PIX49205.1 MAG: phosphoribosylformylglycinamidine synthase I [Candi
MKKVKTIVLSGYGINCENETAYCLKKGNSDVEIVHINDLLSNTKDLMKYQILVFPGGFSFGDDIASGRVLANKLKFKTDEIYKFIEGGNLVLGICNGFQVLVKSGILPGISDSEHAAHKAQQAALTFNDSGKFEDRWVYLKINKKSKCVWTNNLSKLFLPVRHGEGKFFCENKILTKIKENEQIVMQYADENGNFVGYPDNPNGSVENIAGICDRTGRLFGLMPHPEAYNCPENNPLWKFNSNKFPIGTEIFRNGVRFAEENLM